MNQSSTSLRATAAMTIIGLLTIGLAWWWNIQNFEQTETTTATPVRCTEVTLEQQISAADVILTGSVFAVIPAEGSYANVLITPDKTFKGVIPPTGVTIVARAVADGDGVARDDSSDLHFETGQPSWLLFLHQRADGRYNTSQCYGSRLLDDGFNDPERRGLNVV